MRARRIVSVGLLALASGPASAAADLLSDALGPRELATGEARRGDVFYILVRGATLAYRVDRISVVDPSDTSLLRVRAGEDRAWGGTCRLSESMRPRAILYHFPRTACLVQPWPYLTRPGPALIRHEPACTGPRYGMVVQAGRTKEDELLDEDRVPGSGGLFLAVPEVLW